MRTPQEIQSIDTLAVQPRFEQLAREFQKLAYQLEKYTNAEAAKTHAREIMLLLEYSTRDTTTEQVTELAISQRLLGNWRRNWDELFKNLEQRTIAQAEARAIANRLLEMAGLV